MKIKFIKIKNPSEESVVIRAVEISEEIQQAMDLLSGGAANLAVYKGASVFFCRQADIYYIETVDDKVFVYTKNGCYEIKKKLYELEKDLSISFVRISKSMICNIKKIKFVKSEYNGRMKATLLNDENVIISRSYVKNLKEGLGL